MRHFKNMVLLVSIWLFGGIHPGSCLMKAQIVGGMLDPAVDSEDEPFSYFWHPTDVLGTLYAPVASEVTPEGYIYTGFGELMFFLGNPLEPVNQRIKTLHNGHLPIVQYQLCRHGVKYNFQMFAADLGEELEGLPVNFVKVEVINDTHETRTAFCSSGYRFLAPVEGLTNLADYRFRQRFDLIPDKYTDGQTEFSRDWKYSFAPEALVRDGRILYIFPISPQPYQVSLALGDTGLRGVRYFTGEVRVTPDPKYRLNPHTSMGIVTYRLPLQPGESRTLIFKMPIVPLPQGSPEARQVMEAPYQAYLQKTLAFWEDLVVKTSTLRFPEEKVQNYLLANTIYDLLAIDRVGDDYIPNVNKFQYHTFYGGGDTVFMLNALDLMGLAEPARNAFLYSLTTQREDGAFVLPRRPGELKYWETFGWSLLGWGSHYSLTRDKDFLHEVYPGVVQAMKWEKEITSQDPLGLLPPPPAEIADDAFLKSARQTGQHIWLLIGLKNAINLAEATGNNEDVVAFTAEYERFREAFERQLTLQTQQSGGYIPPALDLTLEGNDWDNLHLLWPELLFEPFDPRVTATIRRSREQYVEGVLDFVLPRAVAKVNGPGQGGQAGIDPVKTEGYVFESRRSLHYWQTPNNAQNALVRGSSEDQRQAIRDLYALLLHTTSTHAPQEFGTYPWSTRDYEGASVRDILPDGPASGKTVELLRNMLVREFRDELFLFSALSPAWVKPGSKIEVINAPTTFGPFNLELKVNSPLAYWSWEISISHSFWEEPERVVVRVPWFYEVQRVQVDGRNVIPEEGMLRFASSVREVRIRGRIKPGTPIMSYDRTVQDYKQEYRHRYDEFLRTGVTGP